MNIQKLLKLKAGKPRIPTVEERIENQILVLELNDGKIITISNDLGEIEDYTFKDKKDFESYHGKLDSRGWTRTNKSILGEVITTNFPEVINVWIGWL